MERRGAKLLLFSHGGAQALVFSVASGLLAAAAELRKGTCLCLEPLTEGNGSLTLRSPTRPPCVLQ